MGGGAAPPAPPPPVDYTPAMVAQSSASVEKMAMFVGGQVMQTQMTTSLMNMQGMRDMMLQQDKLDAKLEIASLNYESRAREAEMGHRERMTELSNTHIENLAQGDEIELNSEDYRYPYAWGGDSSGEGSA